MAISAGAFTVIVSAWLSELPAASVTWNVIDPLPPPVGVPEITPVLPLKLNPAGRVPEVMVQVNGLVPPDKASVVL
jgi:hypothetical protein